MHIVYITGMFGSSLLNSMYFLQFSVWIVTLYVLAPRQDVLKRAFWDAVTPSVLRGVKGGLIPTARLACSILKCENMKPATTTTNQTVSHIKKKYLFLHLENKYV